MWIMIGHHARLWMKNWCQVILLISVLQGRMKTIFSHPTRPIEDQSRAQQNKQEHGQLYQINFCIDREWDRELFPGSDMTNMTQDVGRRKYPLSPIPANIYEDNKTYQRISRTNSPWPTSSLTGLWTPVWSDNLSYCKYKENNPERLSAHCQSLIT